MTVHSAASVLQKPSRSPGREQAAWEGPSSGSQEPPQGSNHSTWNLEARQRQAPAPRRDAAHIGTKSGDVGLTPLQLED